MSFDDTLGYIFPFFYDSCTSSKQPVNFAELAVKTPTEIFPDEFPLAQTD